MCVAVSPAAVAVSVRLPELEPLPGLVDPVLELGVRDAEGRVQPEPDLVDPVGDLGRHVVDLARQLGADERQHAEHDGQGSEHGDPGGQPPRHDPGEGGVDRLRRAASRRATRIGMTTSESRLARRISTTPAAATTSPRHAHSLAVRTPGGTDHRAARRRRRPVGWGAVDGDAGREVGGPGPAGTRAGQAQWHAERVCRGSSTARLPAQGGSRPREGLRAGCEHAAGWCYRCSRITGLWRSW